jgi:hypothetical protein
MTQSDFGQTVTGQGGMAGPSQLTDDFTVVGNQRLDLIAVCNVHEKFLDYLGLVQLRKTVQDIQRGKDHDPVVAM